MQRRGTDKRFYDWTRSDFDSLPGTIDISCLRTGNGSDLSTIDVSSNKLDSFKFTRGGDRETAIQGIETHCGQRLGNSQFFSGEIIDAWRLLAISKSRFIKLDDARLLFNGHYDAPSFRAIQHVF